MRPSSWPGWPPNRCPRPPSPRHARGFADTAACILAGLEDPVTVIVRDYAASAFATGNVPALFGAMTTTAEGAALVDATAAHALDFDD